MTNEFEFLGRVTIGQYLPLGSVLHRLDGRARILAAVFLLGALMFAPGFGGLLVGIVLITALLALGRIPLRYALRGLLPPLPFLLILAVLQMAFNVGRDELGPVFWRWGTWAFSWGDVRLGVLLLMRFCALILGLSLATFCISTSELVHGVDLLLRPLNRIHIHSHDFSMVLQVTLRFIPFLAQETERIAKAQASRGAEWGSGRGGLVQRARQVAPLIVPLFVTSLRRAENLALAMDARGYGNPAYTSMAVLRFGWRDTLALLLSGLAAVLIVAL